MNQGRHAQSIIEKVKEYREFLTLFTAVAAVVAVILGIGNAYISYNTQPFIVADKKLEAADIQIEKEFQEHKAEQEKILKNLATKEQVDNLYKAVEDLKGWVYPLYQRSTK